MPPPLRAARILLNLSMRAVSSVGRASALHAGCRGFEPLTAHHTLGNELKYQVFFWQDTLVDRSMSLQVPVRADWTCRLDF